MEFEGIIVKENPGLCRCCLSEGCYKDLSTEYIWMGESEVYADMLMECFDISISQHSDGPNGSSRLICEVCITRLRDACIFKKQVLESEKKFIDMLSRGELRSNVIVYEQPMKEEIQVETVLTTDDEGLVEYLEDDVDYLGNNDDNVNKEGQTEETNTAIFLKEESPRRSKPTASRTEKKKPVKKAVLKEGKIGIEKIGGKTRGAQKAAKSVQKRPKRIRNSDDTRVNDAGESRKDEQWGTLVSSTVKKKSSTRERLEIIRRNIVEVLKRSNIMPFRWLKSSYRCFYCYDIFEDPGELKDHQRMHVGDEVKEKAMNNYWETIVYVDVSNISCGLCPEPVAELYELIDHLIKRHGVEYNKDVGACMYAFKLESLSVTCLVCGANFRTFGPLLTHTNKNHKGCSSILCDACGQHFKYAQLLKEHIKSVHQNCTVLCTKCGVSFDTKNKLRTHEQRNHGRKFKCLVCPEMFPSHYKRSQHMAEEHKNRTQVKCLYCPKKFVFRSMMMSHLRDTHLKEKNHVCGVCGWRAFSVNRLKNHMYKHSGEKQFKCTVCEKAFTTKKIMKAHFSRMHKNNQPSYDGGF